MTFIFKTKLTAFFLLFILFSLSLLIGCTTINVNVSNPIALPRNTVITIGPMANHSDTPLANRQVESMTAGLLHTKGFTNIATYPRPQSCEKLLYCADEAMPLPQLLSWARQHHVSYLLVGAANEWRYKVGLDGEPVAGVTYDLINVATGKTQWSAVGSIIGGSRAGLDGVGQQLLNSLLTPFKAI